MNPLLVHFHHKHLPEVLQKISKPLGEIAAIMAENLDSDDPAAGAEVSVGLRKLLEAKDCFVRAAVILNNINKGV
jgi:hypothetical protein